MPVTVEVQNVIEQPAFFFLPTLVASVAYVLPSELCAWSPSPPLSRRPRAEAAPRSTREARAVRKRFTDGPRTMHTREFGSREEFLSSRYL